MDTFKRWRHYTLDKDPDQPHQLLLDVTIYCLVKYGIERTTIDRITALAQVSKSTVYRYYRDKDHLLKEAFLEAGQLFVSMMEEKTKPYENDFPRFYEECILAAIEFDPVGYHPNDLQNRTEMESDRYFTLEVVHDFWMRLLDKPFKRYVNQLQNYAGQATDSQPSLSDFATVAHLMVAGCRGLQLSESQVRERVRNLPFFQTS